MISSNLFGGSRGDLGPYRATRLWNDIVRTFRAGMPVGRRRKQLKIYEDAFIASDAVTWLHEYLQQNLDTGPEITRPQTVLLLQKFQRSGVIQDVRGDKSNMEPLEDNNHLFRFVRASPKKSAGLRLPFASRTNLHVASSDGLSDDATRAFCGPTAAAHAAAPVLATARRWQSEDTVFAKSQAVQQHSAYRSQSALPKESAAVPLSGNSCLAASTEDSMWKSAVLDQLRKALLLRSPAELPLDAISISGCDVTQNLLQQHGPSSNDVCSRVNHINLHNGALPGWLAIAIRCLANWPEKAADDLPKYPGYEKDVYAMVKDYFESLPEPMIPFRLYHVITYAWAQILVTRRNNGSLSNGTSLAVTPHCEPPPLPPRRRLATSEHSATAHLPKCGNTVSAASSCAMFARIEQGRVHKLPSASLSVSDLNSSVYYTPPCVLANVPARLSAASTNETQLALAGSVQASHGRSPLNFYTRHCIANADAHSRGCKTDGSLVQAIKRLRLLPCSGSMPDLAFRSAAAGSSSECQCSADSTVPTDFGYGSNDSVCLTPSVHRSSCAAGNGQGVIAGTLKKFASVHDVTAAGDCNLVPSQRFFSASDVNGASAFLENSLTTANQKGTSCRGPVMNMAVSGTAVKPRASELMSSCSTGLVPAQHCSRAVRPHPCSLSDSAPVPTVPQGYKPVILGATAARPCGRDIIKPVTLPYAKPAALPLLHAAGTKPDSGVSSSGTRATLVDGYSRNRRDDPAMSDSSLADETGMHAGHEILSEMMHSRLLRSLQLCLLLLPPANRRHLQILLRLLHRLSHNVNLQLGGPYLTGIAATDVPSSTLPCPKDFVLKSFWRSILRCQIEADMDELVAMNIVSFLLENHERVFTVPNDLMKSFHHHHTAVQEQSATQCLRPMSALTQQREPSASLAKARPVTYCEQVTKEEYEEQRTSASERALAELLNNILTNAKITEKEKKKKLKQFQKAYPEIYMARFPTSESEPSYMKEQPKIKQPLLTRPLRLLRTLR